MSIFSDADLAKDLKFQISLAEHFMAMDMIDFHRPKALSWLELLNRAKNALRQLKNPLSKEERMPVYSAFVYLSGRTSQNLISHLRLNELKDVCRLNLTNRLSGAPPQVTSVKAGKRVPLLEGV